MRRPLLLSALLMTASANVIAQTHNVVGKVLDENGQGFQGVGVMVKGTVTGTVTDIDGNFNLDIPDGKNKLIFQALGYSTVVISDTGQSEIVVKMVPTAKVLEGTVVTALGIRREKRELGYNSTTVKGDELTAGNNTSALSGLQGKVAGANISSSTGGAGGSTRVVLRGEKSILKNNNALLVIDGVIMSNYDRTSRAADGTNNYLSQVDFGNSGNDINPDDIESVSVLPGATAAALYGELGANGAIMITTKKGKHRTSDGPSKIDITVKSTYTQSDILMYPKLQHEYGQGNLYNGIADDRRENFSWGARFDGQYRPWGQIIDGKQLVKSYVDQPNNINNFFNHAKNINNFVSLSGGSEKSTYYLSLNSMNSTGVVPNTFYNRYSVRFNGSTQLSNSFYSSMDVNYLSTYGRSEQQGQGAGSVIDNVYQTPRDIPLSELKNTDNKYYSMEYIDTNGNTRYGNYNSYYKNPYWVAKNFDNRNKTDRILGNAVLGVKKGEFDVFNRIGIDVSGDRSTYKTPYLNSTPAELGFNPDSYYGGNNMLSNGGYKQIATNFFNLYNDLIANWSHSFDDNFGMSAMLGNSVMMNQYETVGGEIDPSNNGLVIPGFYNLTNNKSQITPYNELSRERKVGIYSEVKFNYRREVFLNVTARNDWNSTLAIGRNSYFYPSAGASWVFTERIEGTHFKKKVMNYGKIRMSVSGVGSGARAYVNNPAGYTQSSFNSGFGSISSPFNGTPTYQIQSSFGTSALRPEKTRTFEVGTDLSFLNDRLSASFTYYNSRTVDLITAQALPASSGYTARYVNLGTVTNRGVEISMRGTPIQTKWGLKWELYGTFTSNINRVESLAGGASQVTIGGFNGMAIVAAVGQSMGTFYGNDIAYTSDGRAIVDPNTGLPIATSTAVYKGSYQPKFIASWGTDLSWKGIKFHALFVTKQGGKFYTRTRETLGFNGTSAESAQNGRQATVWNNSVYEVGSGTGIYEKNTTAYTPYNYFVNALGSGRYPLQSVVNASYIRLQEASLSYTIPSNLYKRSPFGSLEAGVFGTNLILWTAPSNKYNDPEETSAGAISNGQGLNYGARPSVRNYGVFLKATF